MTITVVQNKVLHALLAKTGTMGVKKDLVFGFTDGRTESSKEMTEVEARQLIKYLESSGTVQHQQVSKQEQQANHMRRKIIAMCHRIGWKTDDGKADVKRLDEWCKTKGYLAKSLNKYTYSELPKLVSQFKILYEYYLTNS